MATDTRHRLMAGAIETVRREGVAGTSARSIGRTAGVNQALIFYHFGSVDGLLAEACRAATAERVDAFRERFARVTSVGALLALGRELWSEEDARGNVSVLAQMLAGAQGNPALAAATGPALALWVAEIEQVLERLLTGSPLGDLVDPAAAARAVCASFVGLSLFETADAGDGGFEALRRLADLAEAVEGLGPVERRLVQRRLRARR